MPAVTIPCAIRLLFELLDMNDSFFKRFTVFFVLMRMIPVKVTDRLSILIDTGLYDFTILVSLEIYLTGI